MAKPDASPHISNTLEYFEERSVAGPRAEVACRDCPAAIWYATEHKIENLRCFCTAMHRPVWSAKIAEEKDEILLCDAREGAIAELWNKKDKA